MISVNVRQEFLNFDIIKYSIKIRDKAKKKNE